MDAACQSEVSAVLLPSSPDVCCRIFGKKLQGPHESGEGSPANAWLAALQQAKASTGMSRDATRGLLTAIHKGGTQQEEMQGALGLANNCCALRLMRQCVCFSAWHMRLRLFLAPRALVGESQVLRNPCPGPHCSS